MEKPYLLHLITSEKNASPFDVNMAYDAGWTNITPYTNVEQSEIQTLIFLKGTTDQESVLIHIRMVDLLLTARRIIC